VIRQPAVDLARQADRLGAQLDAGHVRAGARHVALVEDEVEHVEDDGQRLGRGRREPRARGADRRLRPADALRHRALRNQERTRDLCGGQAADGAQRQRDLRGGRQRFVAAHEEELQRVVLVGRLARRRLARQALLAAAPCTLAAQLVDQPPVRGGEEPAARIGRHAVARPLQRRVEERRQLVDQAPDLGPDLVHRLRWVVHEVGVVVDQQHVLHDVAPFGGSR
jgi:hypothetical protein